MPLRKSWKAFKRPFNCYDHSPTPLIVGPKIKGLRSNLCIKVHAINIIPKDYWYSLSVPCIPYITLLTFFNTHLIFSTASGRCLLIRVRSMPALIQGYDTLLDIINDTEETISVQLLRDYGRNAAGVALASGQSVTLILESGSSYEYALKAGRSVLHLTYVVPLLVITRRHVWD